MFYQWQTIDGCQEGRQPLPCCNISYWSLAQQEHKTSEGTKGQVTEGWWCERSSVQTPFGRETQIEVFVTGTWQRNNPTKQNQKTHFGLVTMPEVWLVVVSFSIKQQKSKLSWISGRGNLESKRDLWWKRGDPRTAEQTPVKVLH